MERVRLVESCQVTYYYIRTSSSVQAELVFLVDPDSYLNLSDPSQQAVELTPLRQLITSHQLMPSPRLLLYRAFYYLLVVSPGRRSSGSAPTLHFYRPLSPTLKTKLTFEPNNSPVMFWLGRLLLV